MILSPHFIVLLFAVLLFLLAATTTFFTFRKKLYSRLSSRIILLVLASGLVTLIMALVFNELALDSIAPNSTVVRWTQLLQISLLILVGPMVIGLFATRFVRRPLRQFNTAITSLEQSDYKVQLQPTGIHEFDEVFIKFNNLMERLQQEEKLRKDLVSDASHELNTPLTTMIGQLTAMEEGKYPLTKERIQTIKEQAERLAELIQQLDAYTKARLPEEYDAEPIHLKAFCEKLIEYFSLELSRKGIKGELDILDDMIIQADPSVLQRILTNLIQNTLRHSSASYFSIVASSDQLIFTDNGKGVSAKKLPYLFERFYRVDKSRSRATGGLGLGLAIVKELVEQQGWKITAQEANPGLAFVITLK